MIDPVSHQPINSIRTHNFISFGTLDRAVPDKQNKGIVYKNNTAFFRKDLYWDMFIDYITKNKDLKKICCYACSDGSEPYSTAMALIAKLGYEKAQEYFPIIARDIDKFVIDKANTGVITIKKSDWKSINKYQKKADIKFFQGEYEPERKECNMKVSEELRRCVDFGLGDLITDSAYMNFDNSITLFRNVWPYLSPKEINILLSNLRKVPNRNAILVVGGYDKNKFTFDNDDNIFFDCMLYKYGISEVRPLIYNLDSTRENSFKETLKDVNDSIICEVLKNYYYLRSMLKN